MIGSRRQRPYRLFAGTRASLRCGVCREESWGMYLVATFGDPEVARQRALTLLQSTNERAQVYCCSIEDSRTGEAVWRGLRAGCDVPEAFKTGTGEVLNHEVVSYTPSIKVDGI